LNFEVVVIPVRRIKGAQFAPTSSAVFLQQKFILRC
jgi:hypothetical protein